MRTVLPNLDVELNLLHIALSTYFDHCTSQERAVRADVRRIHTRKTHAYVKRWRKAVHLTRGVADLRNGVRMEARHHSKPKNKRNHGGGEHHHNETGKNGEEHQPQQQ